MAGGLLTVVRPRALLRLGRRGCAQGVVLGLALAGGYVLQTFGLRYTSAAVSGFLTGLQVVFTPLLAWLLLRNRPAARAMVATVLALAGLAVMSLHGLSFGMGELLTVGAALLFAGQIVGLGFWSSAEDAYGLATVQLLTVAVCCWLATLPDGPRPPARLSDWVAIVVTAVVATAIAFVVQSWAQSQLSTTGAAVVLTMEPVFAALVAWGVGEKLGWPVVLGGGLVVVAMLVVEMAGGKRLTWWARRGLLPGPITPGPITPGPVTPGPVTPGPVTPAPVAAAAADRP